MVKSNESVQTFGRKKKATAVAFVKKGTGLIKVNGSPISLLQPEILKLKTYEPILLLGSERFQNVDIRVRAKGGGTTGQVSFSCVFCYHVSSNCVSSF